MGTSGGGIDQRRAEDIHMKTAPLVHSLAKATPGDVKHPVLWIQGCGFSETNWSI